MTDSAELDTILAFDAFLEAAPSRLPPDAPYASIVEEFASVYAHDAHDVSGVLRVLVNPYLSHGRAWLVSMLGCTPPLTHVEALVAAQINRSWCERTADVVLAAVHHNRALFLRALLERGQFDVDYDRGLLTWTAINADSLDALRVLLDAGCNVSQSYMTIECNFYQGYTCCGDTCRRHIVTSMKRVVPFSPHISHSRVMYDLKQIAVILGDVHIHEFDDTRSMSPILYASVQKKLDAHRLMLAYDKASQ